MSDPSSNWKQGRLAWERLGRSSTRSSEPLDELLNDVRLMRDLLDVKEKQLVVRARHEYRPWSEIAAALGITRQAAWKRWGPIDPRGGD